MAIKGPARAGEEPLQPTERLDDGEARLDYLFSRESGAISDQSTVHLDGAEYPFRMLSTLALWIQLTPDVADALTGETELSTLFRRAGVGRLRKNISTPLEPPPDQIWVQALSTDPVLVWRRDAGQDHAAFFRLHHLSRAVQGTGQVFGRIQVIFVVANDYLPDASELHLRQIVEQRRAYGALIACTEDG